MLIDVVAIFVVAMLFRDNHTESIAYVEVDPIVNAHT